MERTTLKVLSDKPIGTISPRLYGHFAEHLGRCCYGGLWCGIAGDDATHQHGFRRDVVAALKELPVPLLRWPGGCYADHYHWRDGIGPAAMRPRRLGISCGLQVEDSNALGTHEFLWLCRELGAEPYLAGNMGSGSAQELCDWLEYCNSAVHTTLADERAANDDAEPFGVPLWGVGNENWGCGGNYDAETYAREYRRYATMLRHVDPSAELVACGFEDDWNAILLDIISKHLHLVDHLSIHRYWVSGGPELDFSEADYYALLDEAEKTEEFVARTARIITEKTGGKGKIGIALDEWGVWHPEARDWGAGIERVAQRAPVTYEQANTLRDALAAGVALEGFHRQCNVLSMANLAQIVNVLQSVVNTQGAKLWLTPTYHVLKLHKPHIGATALPVEIAGGATLPNGSSALSATASARDGQLAVTLINRHFASGASVTIATPAGFVTGSGALLAGTSPRATNSPDDPDAVQPAALALQRDSAGGWRVELPAHSLATIVFAAG